MAIEPTILQGDVLDRLRELAPGSVHCVVTSPPFWGLRRYDLCGCSHDYVRGDGPHPIALRADGDPIRHKDPDPACRWCGGTGKIGGVTERLWGGDPNPNHAHVWAETPPRRPRKLDEGRGTINKGNRGASYDASGGKTCVKCDGWLGHLGLEQTPGAYVRHMVLVFRELRRVLRGDGVIFCELGDSYLTHAAGLMGEARWKASTLTNVNHDGAEQAGSIDKRQPGLREKNLALVPHRVAIALQEDGWIVRQDNVWERPNPMPESVRDRTTRSHSYVFQIVKETRYFYDADAVRETATGGHSWGNGVIHKMGEEESNVRGKPSYYESMKDQVPAGGARNLRSVWTIPTGAYSEAHFATFPEAIPERCILAGTSEKGACPECGEPWKRVTERWTPTCSCHTDRPPVPCVVLDPFAGSGTTLATAKRLGRRSIGIELNPQYVEMVRRRVAEARTETAHDPAQRRLTEGTWA